MHKTSYCLTTVANITPSALVDVNESPPLPEEFSRPQQKPSADTHFDTVKQNRVISSDYGIERLAGELKAQKGDEALFQERSEGDSTKKSPDPFFRSSLLGRSLQRLVDERSNVPPNRACVAVPKPVRHEAEPSLPTFSKDRRAFPRRESASFVKVVRQHETPSLTATDLSWRLHASRVRGGLIDLSMNGIAFYLNDELAPGETIALRIANPHYDKHIDISAQVVRVEQDENHEYKTVCRFTRKLTFEEVTDLAKHVFPCNVI